MLGVAREVFSSEGVLKHTNVGIHFFFSPEYIGELPQPLRTSNDVIKISPFLEYSCFQWCGNSLKMSSFPCRTHKSPLVGVIALCP